MQKTMIIMVGGALVLTFFTLQNPSNAEMRFMGWQSSQIPVTILIIGSMSFGAIISMLMGLKQTMDLKKTIRRLENELSLLDRTSGGVKHAELVKEDELAGIPELKEIKVPLELKKEGKK